MAQAIGQQQELVESVHESGRTTHGDIGSLEEELKALRLKGEATNVPQPVLEEPGLPVANTREPDLARFSQEGEVPQAHPTSALRQEGDRECMEGTTPWAGLNPEQVRVVNLVQQGMLHEEKAWIAARYSNRDKISCPRIETDSSENDKPETHKGKGPDPGNWGGADLTGDKLDPDIQEQMLELFNLQKKINNTSEGGDNKRATKDEADLGPKDKQGPVDSNKGLKKKHYLPAMEEWFEEITGIKNQRTATEEQRHRSHKTLQPIHQVSRSSALGRMFAHLGSKHDSNSSDTSSSYSRDSSSGSKDNSSNSETDTSKSSSLEDGSGSDASDHMTNCRNQLQKANTQKSKSKKKGKTCKPRKSRDSCRGRRKPTSTVKPIPPEKYNGASDIQKVMQFMNQCSTYLTDGYVEKQCHLTVVASFLTGKA
ncbi:hypothetical protein E4T56_gene11382 [Termitomyces sp. T112]|nr:hypothetical protein E4T56_gene11382 [Termitomyces sp. T112]